jgi:hypothetical protein
MAVFDLIKERKVSIFDYLVRVSGMVERPVPFFLTTSMWARLAEEIIERDLPREAVSTNPSKYVGFSQAEYEASRDNITFAPTRVRPNPANFKTLKIGKLTVVKADSDDQAAVNEANLAAAMEAGVLEKFQWKRDNLRVS